MPKAKNKDAPGLDIQLDPSTPPTLYPGNRLSGKVNLSSTDHVSIGSVTITFYGRAKVKVVQHHGESRSEFRSRANFFSVSQTLFTSPYTFSSGVFSWPFELTLPHGVDEACLRGEKGKVRFKPRDGFLSTETTDILTHQLPPAVNYYHGVFGRQAWAYIEYVLDATVKEGQKSQILRKTKERSSTRVISFQPVERQQAIRDWSLLTRTQSISIRSSKLLDSSTNLSEADNVVYSSPSQPGGSGPPPDPIVKVESRGSASVRSLLSRVSLSSSTPKLTVLVEVSCPTTLQVRHPDPIPIFVSITPDTNAPSTTLDSAAYPKICIKHFTLTLVCATRCRAHTGIFGDTLDQKVVNILLAKDVPVNHVVDLSGPKSLLPSTTTSHDSENSSTRSTTPSNHHPPKSDHPPSSPPPFTDPDTKLSTPSACSLTFSNPHTMALSASTSQSDSLLDLGALLNLRLTSATISRHIHEPSLVPSLSTYNIMREFGLKWSLDLETTGVGGSGRKPLRDTVKGELPRGQVTVLDMPDDVRRSLASRGQAGAVAAQNLDLENVGGEDGDGDGEEGSEGAAPKSSRRFSWMKGSSRGSGKAEKSMSTTTTTSGDAAKEAEVRAERAQRQSDDWDEEEEGLPKYEP